MHFQIFGAYVPLYSNVFLMLIYWEALTLQKSSFLLRNFIVNVTNCGFGRIYYEIFDGKLFIIEWLVRNGIATAPTFTFFFPAGIYRLKVNNGNTRTRCEIAGWIILLTKLFSNSLTSKCNIYHFHVVFSTQKHRPIERSSQPGKALQNTGHIGHI